MIARFEMLVSSGTRRPKQAISELCIMPDDELECVCSRFNDTASTPFQELCAHELVAAHTVVKPRAIAVECDGEVPLTYAMLLRISQTLAPSVAAPGTTTALQLRRTAELIAVIIAVLSGGGVYLPFDANWPLERRLFMLEDADCSRLVVHAQFAAEFGTSTRLCVLVEEALLVDWPRRPACVLQQIGVASMSTSRVNGTRRTFRPLSNRTMRRAL